MPRHASPRVSGTTRSRWTGCCGQGEPASWRGIALTAHAQPGHRRYGVCIAFEVDGAWPSASSSQPSNDRYTNRFSLGAYPATAHLRARLAPGLVLPVHGCAPAGPEAVAAFRRHAARVDALHRALLPLHEVDFGAGGQAVEIRPYRAVLRPAEEREVTVLARNPFRRPAEVRLALLPGGAAEPREVRAPAEVPGPVRVRLRLWSGYRPVRRGRSGVDRTVDDQPSGR
jgi:hypothetical protein